MSDEPRMLSEDEARAAERKLYLASDAYRRWNRVRRFQNHRFKSNVDGNKALFDFVRMVLTTALVVGLAVFIGSTAPPGAWGLAKVVSAWLLAWLLFAATLQAAVRFTALVVTNTFIGMSAGYPSGRKGAAGFAVVLLLVSILTFVAITSVAWEVGAQAAKRVQPDKECEVSI